jgi:hypothetical protein
MKVTAIRPASDDLAAQRAALEFAARIFTRSGATPEQVRALGSPFLTAVADTMDAIEVSP